jgi:hypothetical protein
MGFFVVQPPEFFIGRKRKLTGDYSGRPAVTAATHPVFQISPAFYILEKPFSKVTTAL